MFILSVIIKFGGVGLCCGKLFSSYTAWGIVVPFDQVFAAVAQTV